MGNGAMNPSYTGMKTNAYNVLVRKTKGKRAL
jgi:hypothetical protein